MNLRSARYAVDDLHRLEAIVTNKAPPTKSYSSALAAMDEVATALRKDPYGLEDIKQDMERLISKFDGIKRTVKAVQLARHVVSLKVRGARLSEAEQSLVDEADELASIGLSDAGVAKPQNLSFGILPAEVADADGAGDFYLGKSTSAASSSPVVAAPATSHWEKWNQPVQKPPDFMMYSSAKASAPPAVQKP